MKMRKLAFLLFVLLLPCFAAAEVPDAVLHDAIATLFSEPSDGECWVEGHIVLDTKETADEAIVYAQVYAQDFGFMSGIFTDTGSGFLIPMRFTFDKTPGGFVLREIVDPEDGMNYAASLKEIMSRRAYRKLNRLSDADTAEMKRQMYAQAQAYLDSIGRTEPVGDWRDLNLQLADMFVPASNHIICFYKPYPLDVTTRERLENGERFVYTRDWEADSAFPGGGVCTLTKVRREDGALLETIRIHVTENEMTVVFTDPYGEKTHRFAFDGETYHQPIVTETGACRVRYPEFDRYNAQLPQ